MDTPAIWEEEPDLILPGKTGVDTSVAQFTGGQVLVSTEYPPVDSALMDRHSWTYTHLSRQQGSARLAGDLLFTEDVADAYLSRPLPLTPWYICPVP